ncbi:MAG: 23S rRNA (guanosine(2251)-2'-O)-methyltransferase RlmB [Clostridia bacterium]|nr:23S rRNA (guanosine(2251)-2'-O)-methyltransferase RlmB [Clostridia bacterium]
MAENFANDTNAVCGRNAVSELLASGRPVDKLLVKKGEKDGALAVIVAKAVAAGIPVVEAPKQRLDSYSPHNQGVAALTPEREYATIDDILALAASKNEPPFIVILDHVNDPHNLGAVIRSAECAGAHGVIIPKRNAAAMGSIASKAAAGADAHVPVCRVPNVASAIDELKARGVWIYAAEADGSSIYDADISGSAAFVLGSEGGGVSRLAREKSDFVISIPMYGKINSLNVSAAAAVVLFEAARRRHA